MEELCMAASLMCCGAYKNDSVVKSFLGTFSDDGYTALNSYSSLCGELLSRGDTLSGCLFRLAVDAENPILKKCLGCPSEAQKDALKNDLEVLSKIASVPAESIVSALRSRFSVPCTVNFPYYKEGDTVIDTHSVISYVQRYGSSVFEKNKAFSFDGERLVPSADFDTVQLSDLKNYRSQQQKLTENTLCLLNGGRAQNALLYGDRGTGKSSTVKALVNKYDNLRVVQVQKSGISGLSRVYELLKDNPLKFILFIDDISFCGGEEGYSALKQALEGSVVPMPLNCAIYATTNRMHIIKETESERSGDELHAADARDENMSLADRFGLYITFPTPGKDEYLDIVRKIAADRGIDADTEELKRLAERFALKKCGRSPRTAKQFVDIIQSKMELKLGYDVI